MIRAAVPLHINIFLTPASPSLLPVYSLSLPDLSSLMFLSQWLFKWTGAYLARANEPPHSVCVDTELFLYRHVLLEEKQIWEKLLHA